MTEKKEPYFPPQIEVFDVTVDCCIAASFTSSKDNENMKGGWE